MEPRKHVNQKDLLQHSFCHHNARKKKRENKKRFSLCNAVVTKTSLYSIYVFLYLRSKNNLYIQSTNRHKTDTNRQHEAKPPQVEDFY